MSKKNKKLYLGAVFAAVGVLIATNTENIVENFIKIRHDSFILLESDKIFVSKEFLFDFNNTEKSAFIRKFYDKGEFLNTDNTMHISIRNVSEKPDEQVMTIQEAAKTICDKNEDCEMLSSYTLHENMNCFYMREPRYHVDKTVLFHHLCSTPNRKYFVSYDGVDEMNTGFKKEFESVVKQISDLVKRDAAN